MKNKILFALLISMSAWISAFSQSIPNYSFENWSLDTNYLSLTLTTPVTYDTTISSDPIGWTTSNDVSNGAVFGHKLLVTQSATAYTGSSAIQLRSDSLSALLYGLPSPLPSPYPVSFVCPGFAVCGRFPINISAFVNLGSSFNPALLAGAGIPISGRYSKIGGYMKYTPVGNDTAYVIAVLRKGTTVVAEATYKHFSTDAGYVYFEAPFVYQNCLAPDTMVYTLSSGDPYSISNVAFGTPSGLHVGSALLADSIFLADTIPGFGIALPVNDNASTVVNTPVTVHVTNNDVSCSGGTFTLSQSVAPVNGSIVISGQNIIYTPNNDFLGTDVFTYAESIGSGPTATAQVTVNVTCGPAMPQNDYAHTNVNTSVSVPVTANDSSCPVGTYTISQDSLPHHGTITISGDTIKYTPDSGFVGIDTFSYNETVGGGTSGTALVIINVTYPAGISELAKGKTSIYPNPASTKLYVTNSNPAVSELKIFDMLGKALKEESFTSSATVDLSGFSNGLYIAQFSGNDGKVVSSSRFTVIK